jgi:2-(1,2-epoxy-1,2-dihydrophenyl)acetyl-CoA isomerase
MNYEYFDCEIQNGAATVSLLGMDAPPLDELSDEFLDLMLRLQEDNRVRAILIADGGHSFDLAPDLDRIARGNCDGHGFDSLTPDLDIARKFVTFIHEMGKPVLAAARGAVRESGFGLFLAADVRLASSTASFMPPDMSRGLLPDWGLSATLPRLLGPSRALELIWSRRTIHAAEAGRIGLVDRVIEDEVWDEELAAFVDRLSNLPQPAVRLMKLAAQQAPQLDMTTMLAYEYEAQQQCWDSHETTEGMAAFLAGRDPEFTAPVSEEEE